MSQRVNHHGSSGRRCHGLIRLLWPWPLCHRIHQLEWELVKWKYVSTCIWTGYPRERTPHFFEPHANPLIQKRPLHQCFCGRRMGDYPGLRLFEEMIRHGHTKNAPNLRFASPAFLGDLGKRSSFADRETQCESKPINRLQGWRP